MARQKQPARRSVYSVPALSGLFMHSSISSPERRACDMNFLLCVCLRTILRSLGGILVDSTFMDLASSGAGDTVVRTTVRTAIRGAVAKSLKDGVFMFWFPLNFSRVSEVGEACSNSGPLAHYAFGQWTELKTAYWQALAVAVQFHRPFGPLLQEKSGLPALPQ